MRYKILIVDDSYINRELLKEMLKDEYDILEAENGKKALKMIEHKEQIDGILLDLISFLKPLYHCHLLFSIE